MNPEKDDDDEVKVAGERSRSAEEENEEKSVGRFNRGIEEPEADAWVVEAEAEAETELGTALKVDSYLEAGI